MRRETEAEFRERLHRKAAAIEAARLSLMERVREFVATHARHGSKTGRSDYSKLISLDAFEPMRVALDEYDRVRAAPAPPAEPPTSNRCGCDVECQDRHDCRYITMPDPEQGNPEGTDFDPRLNPF